MFWIAYFGNFWIYPVFAVFGWPEKILFIVVCCVILFLSYITGEILTTIFWSECVYQYYLQWLFL
jgi:hypothetical protein